MTSGVPVTLAGRRVLVTGASGFLGSHLIERLVKEGSITGGLARHTGPLRGDSLAEIRFYRCDITDAEAIRDVFSEFQPETVIHLAARPDSAEGFEQARDAVSTNLIGTINMLEALRQSGGGVFIYGDSAKVYGDAEVPYREATPVRPVSSYAIAKAAGWDFCRQYGRLHGLCCVSLRTTLLYGPGQGLNLISFIASKILQGADRVKLDGGTQTRDPLFIEDVVCAYIEAARRGKALCGRVINIGGGCERTVQEIAEMVARQMRSDIVIESDPRDLRPTDMQRSYCDNVEAQALLGWRPKVDLREGLERALSSRLSGD